MSAIKMSNNNILKCTFAIIGGGIAGVSCVKSLNFLDPEKNILFITSSPLIKTVTNIAPLGKTLIQFDVEEESPNTLNNESIQVIQDTVVHVDVHQKILTTLNKKLIKYEKLCLCNGAKPKLIADNNEFIIGIRDTESVIQFCEKLKSARKVVIVGNGGIASEIVHEIHGVEVVWVIKDKHITATFVDPGAGEFFCNNLYELNLDEKSNPVKRMKYTIFRSNDGGESQGPALGPDWHEKFEIKGHLESRKIQVEYECEVEKFYYPTEKQEWPIYLELTNGKTVGCDLIVSATGVTPNVDITGLENLEKAPDGGFKVDWKLETSEKDIYAAGDVCTADWELAKNWFQMRLWTQAHQMGIYAAKSMTSSLRNEEFLQDFCFEIFTHVTKLFGYKVVLLGLFNGQKLNKNYEILLRMTKGKEYIKLVLEDGKMQGAILIGDTDLEEMCENLILNQLDLSIYGEDLLNPNIDIEDYFD